MSGGVSPCPPGCTKPLTPALASSNELLLPAVLIAGAWPTVRVIGLILTAVSHIHRGSPKINSQQLKELIAFILSADYQSCKM